MSNTCFCTDFVDLIEKPQNNDKKRKNEDLLLFKVKFSQNHEVLKISLLFRSIQAINETTVN